MAAETRQGKDTLRRY